MSRGGEAEKLVQKKLSYSPQRKHTIFWRGPKFHKEKVIIIVCSFLSQQSSWKAIESARKTQCRLPFWGKWKKKKRGPRLPPSYPLLRHIFIPLLDFAVFLWLPWHQRDKCLASILKLHSLTNKIVSI